MSYLAKANVALSVSITTVSTLLAPFVTPALIYLFANEWLEVSFVSMLWSVVQVVLIPIALGIVLQIINRKIAEKSFYSFANYISCCYFINFSNSCRWQ